MCSVCGECADGWHRPQVAFTVGRELQSNFNSASRNNDMELTAKKDACKCCSVKQHQQRRHQQPNAVNSMLLHATVQVGLSRGKHGSLRLRRVINRSCWRGSNHLPPRLALRARHYLAIGTWGIRRYYHQFQLVACASCWMIRRSRY